MARLALCAVGLALAAGSASTGHGRRAPADQTGLFQIGRGSAVVSTDADDTLLGEGSGDLTDTAGYVPEDYKEGELVETKLGGKWVLAAIQGLRSKSEHTWDVKVQGQDLQGVPAKLLRRRLAEGESDWLVVNKGQRSRVGITYRRSKDVQDIVADLTYAPFDTLVVGSHEDGWVKTKEDGWLKTEDEWVKTSRGYLPMHVDGKQVLAKRDRKGVSLSAELVDWYLEAEEARRKAALAKAALEPPPLQSYEENEEVLFQTSDGSLSPARVAAPHTWDTYSVLVRPAEGSEYTVSHVHPNQLRKTGPPKHKFVAGESKMCKKDGGCIEVLVKDTSGKEKKLHTGLGNPLQHLVRSACTGLLHAPWSCETRLALWHHGRALPHSWRTFEAGLADGAVVDVKLAPVSTTPVGEHS